MKIPTIIVAALLASAGSAQYTPDWTSLDKRPLPAWYDQAKFGIFIHWGVFSVPAVGTESGGASGEWFWWMWKGTNSSFYVDYMNANYPPGFSYPEFAPQFKAELWDPNAWASLFASSGAKYVVLTSKHHEGWCNWPSNVSWNWNSADNGPHRDLVGDLTTAVRAKGLHMGLYHSLFEWFNPLYLADKANGYNTTVYVDTVLQPQLHDIVNRYQPEVIWSDGDWEATDTYWKSKEFLAWLYNESPVKDTVVVDDRWGSGDTCTHGGYFTCNDRYSPGKLQNHKWENALTVDQYSWGFRRNAVLTDYLSVGYFVGMLAETVSCGGNMLLNVGPNKDGMIDAIFADRLTGIGAWLGVNGEAIYNSVPWRVQNETAASVWYTAAGAAPGSPVYAIMLAWPQNGMLTLNLPVTTGSTAVTMLGVTGQLTWKSLGAMGIQVTLPQFNPGNIPCKDAWTIKLTGVN